MILECPAEGPSPLKGDMLVIAGATLYAVSNVTEEYIVKKSSRIEVMAMLGVFGAIISGIQISILEREELRSTEWNASAVLPFIGFALAMFLFYSTVPIILKICGATMLNLSLLTSDMWAVLIRIFAYHEKVDWMYFVAFAGTAIGLIIYSYKGSREAAEDTAQVTGATDEEAATENHGAERVPGAGEDDGPDTNKSPSEAATSR
uniref:Solute carrier family 35 member F1 n=1 Tax=Aegilops tauschii subsp. strangulata TaxID=200361 RepID=A0A453LAQ9_AEGTS